MNDDLIKNLFDEYLIGKYDEEFEKIVENTGVYGIIYLADKIKYPKTDEIIEKALTITFKNLKIKQKPIIELAYGCRHPDSKKNEWDKAFVVVKSKDSKNITMAMFDNGMDYIGNTYSYNEAYNAYNHYIKEGWIPMDNDDIEKTAGVTISKETRTKPYKNNKFLYGIVTILAISGLIKLLL